jgi:hypothetical protein
LVAGATDYLADGGFFSSFFRGFFAAMLTSGFGGETEDEERRGNENDCTP